MIYLDRMENLMSQYTYLTFCFEKEMPRAMPGLIVGDFVFINSNRSKTKQYETLIEEIGHYEKSVGNISDYSDPDSKKQEAEARRWAYTHAVTLDELIYCYEHHLHTIDDITEHLEISAEYLNAALEVYRQKHGEQFYYHHYHFDLRSGLNIDKL